MGSEGLPLPPVAAIVAVLVECVGGILLIVGYQTRLTGIVLAAWCIVTALVAHRNFGDQDQMIHFLKNVAMAGGFFQLAAFGAGRWSIDARRSTVGAASEQTLTSGAKLPPGRDPGRRGCGPPASVRVPAPGYTGRKRAESTWIPAGATAPNVNPSNLNDVVANYARAQPAEAEAVIAAAKVCATTQAGAIDVAAGGIAMASGIRDVPAQTARRIEKLAPKFDAIISTSEPIVELGRGFGGPLGPTEGPLWWKEGGCLLFSDINVSKRMKYTQG
jgi:putative oxidoreductase